MIDLTEALKNSPYKPLIITLQVPEGREPELKVIEQGVLELMEMRDFSVHSFSRMSDTKIMYAFPDPENAAKAKENFLRSDRNSLGSVVPK